MRLCRGSLGVEMRCVMGDVSGDTFLEGVSGDTSP